MKAIILNSGVASRLKPLTDEMPKCLLEVKGETLLGRQLKCLEKCGITELIITTGPFEEKIVNFVGDNFSELRTAFIRNPRYASTNYIYSIWLARDLLDDDILLLHGDMLFDCSLLQRIVAKESGNHVLVNKVIEPPEKDFKARIEKERVMEIGVNLSGPNVYFCAPIYRFSRQGFRDWLKEIKICLDEGQFNCYAEEAFNRISSGLKLDPIYYSTEECMEIDSPEDLQLANSR